MIKTMTDILTSCSFSFFIGPTRLPKLYCNQKEPTLIGNYSYLAHQRITALVYQ